MPTGRDSEWLGGRVKSGRGGPPAATASATVGPMNLVNVFLETVEDLRARCSLTATEYDAVQASGLLRRLLTDGQAVAPRFIAAWELRPPTYRWMSAYHGDVSSLLLDPEISESTGVIERLQAERSCHTGSLVEFLKVNISTGVTVKDLIRHYAHAEGGVHHGANRERIDSRLASLLASEANELKLRLTLVAIGRIVCRALAGASAVAAIPDLHPRRLDSMIHNGPDPEGSVSSV